ncbi:MAG: hypothetical protein IPL80_19860 [Sterolibacteriaceae bacterium]|nr:hypothetical protein [Sterolibacteriaceae bacterium]
MSTEKEDRTARRQAVMWLMRNIDAIDLVSTRIGIDRNGAVDLHCTGLDEAGVVAFLIEAAPSGIEAHHGQFWPEWRVETTGVRVLCSTDYIPESHRHFPDDAASA